MSCEIFKIDSVNIPGVQRIKPKHIPIMDERGTVDGGIRRDVLGYRVEYAVTLNGLTGAERLSVLNLVKSDLGVRQVELPEFVGNALLTLPDDAPLMTTAANGDVSAGALTVEVKVV